MQVAQFVRPEDHVPFELCTSLYGQTKYFYDGYTLLDLGNERVRCWYAANKFIIGCRGTTVGGTGGFADLKDDLVLSQGGECGLSIVDVANRIVGKLKSGEPLRYKSNLRVYGDITGYSLDEIIVCGHSLGGAAAFCITRQHPEITRCVSFNGAAPIVGGPHLGAGKEKSRFYHIVGDIISTHMDEDSCEVFRIKLPGSVDWNNPAWYHSTNRFYWEGLFEYWSAQNEQDDIQDYVYNTTLGTYFVTLLTGVVSKYLNRDRLRELVCSTPIPGSESGGPCGRDYSIPGGQIAGVWGGAWLGWLLTGSEIGASLLAATPFAIGGAPFAPIAGAYLGYRLSRGEGLLDITNPINLSRKKFKLR